MLRSLFSCLCAGDSRGQRHYVFGLSVCPSVSLSHSCEHNFWRMAWRNFSNLAWISKVLDIWLWAAGLDKTRHLKMSPWAMGNYHGHFYASSRRELLCGPNLNTRNIKPFSNFFLTLLFRNCHLIKLPFNYTQQKQWDSGEGQRKEGRHIRRDREFVHSGCTWYRSVFIEQWKHDVRGEGQAVCMCAEVHVDRRRGTQNHLSVKG